MNNFVSIFSKIIVEKETKMPQITVISVMNNKNGENGNKIY